MAIQRLPGVLLDANAYRGLSDTRFDALLDAERRRGVARYSEPFVASEFLAHLAAPADPAYWSCRRAVGRLYRRCNVSTGGECGILRDSESRFAEFVTGKAPEAHDAYTETVVAPLVGDIGLTPLDQPLTRMEPNRRAHGRGRGAVRRRRVAPVGAHRGDPCRRRPRGPEGDHEVARQTHA